jgi:pyridoxal phosphate enzyme (YggS family)
LFGENRATELRDKAPKLPADIHGHFLGHLQTNKVRMIAPLVTMIHSIDSERLLQCVDAEARRIGRCIDILLQLHVAQEETKTGFTPDELFSLVDSGILESLPGVRVRGIMGMASNTDDSARIAADFTAIRAAFDSLAAGRFTDNSEFDTVSMGMSHDYLTAIDHGSTMVRIGTTIFGPREY